MKAILFIVLLLADLKATNLYINGKNIQFEESISLKNKHHIMVINSYEQKNSLHVTALGKDSEFIVKRNNDFLFPPEQFIKGIDLKNDYSFIPKNENEIELVGDFLGSKFLGNDDERMSSQNIFISFASIEHIKSVACEKFRANHAIFPKQNSLKFTRLNKGKIQTVEFLSDENTPYMILHGDIQFIESGPLLKLTTVGVGNIIFHDNI